MEVHLAGYCGEEDVVTPIEPANEDHRPRNYNSSAGAFYNHMPAAEILPLCGDFFASAYKFCFERHPVQKCLSYFAMMKNATFHRSVDDPQTWSEYLDRGSFPVDTYLYVDGAGDLLVDRIFRYEELDLALAELERTVGIPAQPIRAREKSGFRHGVPSFEAVMQDPVARKRIFDAFESSLQFTPY